MDSVLVPPEMNASMPSRIAGLPVRGGMGILL